MSWSSNVPPPPRTTGSSGRTSRRVGSHAGTPVVAQFTSGLTSAPNSTQGGNHSTLMFDHVFKLVNTKGDGLAHGSEAVPVWQRSKLPLPTLSEIWKIVDVNNLGYLNKEQHSVAMRLIGLAQNQRPLDPSMFTDLYCPKFEGINPPPSATPPASSSGSETSTRQVFGSALENVSPEEKQKYLAIFQGGNPTNGFLDGNACRNILLNSKLPEATLAQIWVLVDADNQGKLDVSKFSMALHIVYKLLDGSIKQVPSTISPGLSAQFATFGRTSVPRTSISSAQTPTLQKRMSSQSLHQPSSPFASVHDLEELQMPVTSWSITPQLRIKFDGYFDRLDSMKSGYLTGGSVIEFFKKSGVPDNMLARIWDMSDVKKEGKLQKPEFAIAMFLIRKHLSGVMIPSTLPASLLSNSSTSNASSSMGIAAKDPYAVFNDMSQKPPMASSTFTTPNMSAMASPMRQEPSPMISTMAKRSNHEITSTSTVDQMTKQIQSLNYDTGLREAELYDQQTRHQAAAGQLDQLAKEKAQLEATLMDLNERIDSERLVYEAVQQRVIAEEQTILHLKNSIEQGNISQQKLTSEIEFWRNKLQELGLPESEENVENSPAVQALQKELQALIGVNEQLRHEIEQLSNKSRITPEVMAEAKRQQEEQLLNGIQQQIHQVSLENKKFQQQLSTQPSSDPFSNLNFPTNENPTSQPAADPFSTAAVAPTPTIETKDAVKTDNPFKTDPFMNASTGLPSEPAKENPFGSPVANLFGSVEPAETSHIPVNNATDPFSKNQDQTDPFASDAVSSPFDTNKSKELFAKPEPPQNRRPVPSIPTGKTLELPSKPSSLPATPLTAPPIASTNDQESNGDAASVPATADVFDVFRDMSMSSSTRKTSFSANTSPVKAGAFDGDIWSNNAFSNPPTNDVGTSKTADVITTSIDKPKDKGNEEVDFDTAFADFDQTSDVAAKSDGAPATDFETLGNTLHVHDFENQNDQSFEASIPNEKTGTTIDFDAFPSNNSDSKTANAFANFDSFAGGVMQDNPSVKFESAPSAGDAVDPFASNLDKNNRPMGISGFGDASFTAPGTAMNDVAGFDTAFSDAKTTVEQHTTITAPVGNNFASSSRNSVPSFDAAFGNSKTPNSAAFDPSFSEPSKGDHVKKGSTDSGNPMPSSRKESVKEHDLNAAFPSPSNPGVSANAFDMAFPAPTSDTLGNAKLDTTTANAFDGNFDASFSQGESANGGFDSAFGVSTVSNGNKDNVFDASFPGNNIDGKVTANAFDAAFPGTNDPFGTSAANPISSQPPAMALDDVFGAGGSNSGNVNGFESSFGVGKLDSNGNMQSEKSLPSYGQDAIAELVNMGFSREQAIDALKRYDNDIEKATNYLLERNNDVNQLVNMGFTKEQANDALFRHDNSLEKATNFLLDQGKASKPDTQEGAGWADFSGEANPF